MDPHGTCIGYLQINKVKVAVAEQHVLEMYDICCGNCLFWNLKNDGSLS
jgi:hypothetical protein